VIANAHHIIDMGPEGGERGGRLLYQWPRDGVLTAPESFTGECLQAYFDHKKTLTSRKK
jgi:excinuclease UvrABC ATPase subunit